MDVPSAATLIRCKRDGQRLDAKQLRIIARGIASGDWSEGQVGAFAMALAWRGMTIDECREFTFALRDSGQSLRWDDLPGPVLDKHSTGGVGDCVSLVLAPLLAACGAYVPMISGRGLGHTGGTLDKLESLPGYDVNPPNWRLRKTVADIGCAIIGQSDDLVPADRRLYGVRDVTATVDVPDMMVASILSKKLAGGAQAMVLDIKTGNGAQLTDMASARALADRMLAVAAGSGLHLRVALTDMDEVLGRDAGNALEVRAVLDLLCGRAACDRLRNLTLAMSAELLCLGGIATTADDASARVRRALDSGAAAERFARMVAALGGPSDLLERPDAYLPRTELQRDVLATSDGYVSAVDVRALGNVVVELGGGRKHPAQAIDHAVGLSGVVGRGARIQAGQPMATIHARGEAETMLASEAVRRAFVIAESAPPVAPLLQWHARAENAA
ncbi:MAG: thymidine phosphorylase [Gammaproteobacteria bacterium RIFCSPHIGHO2_12_FULL_63_22]|nr:MAG: thymidine phosphorylase [Gammaproteobacteria bacterium RIFCSPHIGHO2_12_FULL_63_22]